MLSLETPFASLEILKNCLQSENYAQSASEIALVEAWLLYHASAIKDREEIWVSFEKLAKKKSDFGVSFKKSVYQANLDKK